jgi:hypothetical protein
MRDSMPTALAERKPAEEILGEIVDVCFAALDPILTRQDLIRKIREIYILAAPDEDGLDDDGDVDSDDE